VADDNALEGLGLERGDLLLLALKPPHYHELRRIQSLHQALPGIGIVVYTQRSAAGRELELLASGVLEIIHRLDEAQESVARARARVGQITNSPWPARNGALEGLIPNLHDWISVLSVSENGDFAFEAVNPPLGAPAGFLNPDFVGRSPLECLPPAISEPMVDHLAQAMQEGRPLLFEDEQRVDGEPHVLQTIVTPVRNKWGRIHRVVVVSRDFTPLRRAQEALSASEERLHFALDGTQQGLWDWDLVNGRIYRSPRWCEMLGLEKEEVLDTLEGSLERVHPDDQRQLEESMAAHLEGRTARFQSEYRLRTQSGDWVWVFDAGMVAAWGATGEPTRVTGLCTDITERRRAEEALRALVGGVVHEIRNPVYGISINLDAMEATFGEEPRYLPFVVAMKESADRIENLMNDLRDYAEPRTLNPEPCLVRTLLEDAIRSCQSLAAERSCKVELCLDDPETVLAVNPRRMHQVFRNLVENALHHAPAGSLVLLKGRREREDRHAWWVGTVEDDGLGFAADVLPRAFEPFFTRRSGGTGLGLSIVKRVVEEHGGSVEATNRSSGGARLTVRLPVPRGLVRSTGTLAHSGETL
jgi:PAS domain S-box-containing protein